MTTISREYRSGCAAVGRRANGRVAVGAAAGGTGCVPAAVGAGVALLAGVAFLAGCGALIAYSANEAQSHLPTYFARAQDQAGALAAQRALRISAPIYRFVGASTITSAVTVFIEGAPSAGTNATITNSYALYVGGGTTRLGGALVVDGAAGVGGAAPASAALAVTSTTQGVLFPRMTETQRDAIAAPAEGLVIYNTTSHKLNVRVAAAWEAITSA